MRLLIAAAELPPPVQQHPFARGSKGRWFRMDGAYPERLVGYEVEGGTWMRRNSHTSGHNHRRYCERQFLLDDGGWWVVRCNPEELPLCVQRLRHALEKRGWRKK